MQLFIWSHHQAHIISARVFYFSGIMHEKDISTPRENSAKSISHHLHLCRLALSTTKHAPTETATEINQRLKRHKTNESLIFNIWYSSYLKTSLYWVISGVSSRWVCCGPARGENSDGAEDAAAAKVFSMSLLASRLETCADTTTSSHSKTTNQASSHIACSTIQSAVMRIRLNCALCFEFTRSTSE